MSSEDINTFVSPLQTSKYAITASFAVLIVNYFYTLTDEYELIWKSRWSFTKILFFTSRYLVFVYMLLNVIVYNASTMPYDSCVSICWAVTYIGALGIGIAQIILLLRTYAIWGGSNKKFLVGLSAFSLAVLIAVLSSSISFGKTIRYGPPPLPGIIACIPVIEHNYATASDYLLVLLHETVIAGLTTYRGLKHFRHLRSPLWNTLFRQGIIYYFLIVASMIAPIILLFRSSVQVSTCLDPLQAVLHSVVSCRMILHLRAVDAKENQATTLPLESLRFAGPRHIHSTQFSEMIVETTSPAVES